MQLAIFALICFASVVLGADVGRRPDVMKTNDFSIASLTAANPMSNSESSEPIKSDSKKDEPKSAAKPEELDKARTHSLGLGLQGIIENIKNKLQHTNLVSAYPVPLIQQQPISTHYVQQPSYYQSYSLPSASLISSPTHVISSPASYYSSPAVISAQPAQVNYLSAPAVTHQVSAAPVAVSQTTLTKPLVSYNSHVVQKPVYTISQQVIHKPVYTEIQEVIHKPVYTEIQEVIHKPVLTELQQVIKKPLFTEHVVKKPLYNAVHQELVDRPLHLQTEQYHVVDKPYSQVIQLPQQIAQPSYTNHVVQTPVYHQQAITSTSYHVQAPAAHITSAPVISSGLNYAPYSSPLTYLNRLPSYWSSAVSSNWSPAVSSNWSPAVSSNWSPAISSNWSPAISSNWSPAVSSNIGYHVGTPAVSSLGLSPAISTISAAPAIQAPAISTISSAPSISTISTVPATISAPAISASPAVSVGYPWGASGVSVGYPWGAASGSLVSGSDDLHYGYLSESICRAQGGCGGRAADGSEFFQQMNYEQPQFQNFPSPVYGIPSQAGSSFVPMPYGLSSQQMGFQSISGVQRADQPTVADQRPKAEKSSGAKSADSEDGTSGDRTYYVPADGQGQGAQQQPMSEEYLKSAIREEEKTRAALKDDLDNLSEIAKKIQENPEAMEKIREVIDEAIKSSKSKTVDVKPTGN